MNVSPSRKPPHHVPLGTRSQLARPAVSPTAGWLAVLACLWLTVTAGHSQTGNEFSVPKNYPGLERLWQPAERIFTGGEPHGDAAFAKLQQLGVTVIVSVDGARPDVQRARQHGMRYVHIPVGYDGISPSAAAALTRVVREANGPIYIHCHHGQHRGPAAAAIACIAAGHLSPQQATKVLETAGTSPDYGGLWRDVRQFVPPPPGTPLPELPEIAQVSSLAAAMAQLDRHFDMVRACQKNGWQPPQDHPDVVPAREALLVEENLREAERLVRLSQLPMYQNPFPQWLKESETLAQHLRQSLADRRYRQADEFLRQLEQSCKQCHRRFRD